MRHSNLSLSILTATLLGLLSAGSAWSQPDGAIISAEKRRVVEHWTPERRTRALPRELLVDARGRAYLRAAEGHLLDYRSRRAGNQLYANPVPQARPGAGNGGNNDTTPPSISELLPNAGSTIGSSQEFSARISDASGIKSVSFIVTYPDGATTQSFSPGFIGDDTWAITLNGFSDGQWSWQVVARDAAPRGGNTATSAAQSFTVDTGNGGGGSGDNVSNAAWSGGLVQLAAGRIYFEMPSNKRRRRWDGYVCSGTVASDATSGRSVIITAAHCVYDDAAKAFARKVLFIPDQDGTSGAGTDLNCSNDPLGCWVPSFGVVDTQWSGSSFPDNAAWDYAYYVVPDSGAHQPGQSPTSPVLDQAAGAMSLSFSTPLTDDGQPGAASPDFTHALGYSYSDDPNFMYCAEDMGSNSNVNWWLAGCGLSGGASGGPWVQPMDTSLGEGPVISVNSWGYTSAPGMAGPRLDNSSAQCLFSIAVSEAFSAVPSSDGDAGVQVSCP